MIGDGATAFADIFGALASAGSKVGVAAINADAQTTVARDQADAQSSLGVSQNALDLALARLNAARTDRTIQSVSYGLGLAGIVASLALGLWVLS